MVGHLGCFRFGTIWIKLIWTFLDISIYFFGYMPKTLISGYYAYVQLQHILPSNFPKWLCQLCLKSPIFLPLHQHLILPILFILAVLLRMYVQISHYNYIFYCNLIYIFLKKYLLNLLFADYVPSPDLEGVGHDWQITLMIYIKREEN